MQFTCIYYISMVLIDLDGNIMREGVGISVQDKVRRERMSPHYADMIMVN